MRYEDLAAPQTAEQIAARLKEQMQLKGMQPASWKKRSVPAILVAALAVLLEQIYALLRYFAGGSRFDEAAEQTLAVQWAYSQFMLTPLPAVPAEFLVELAVADTAPAVNLSAGFLLETTWRLQFSLKEAITIESGQTGAALFVCLTAGTSGNVSPELISVMPFPEAGLTHEALELVVSGTDAETVPELFDRCTLRWGGIGADSAEFVANLALQVDTLLRKIKTKVTGVGQLTIYAGQVASAGTPEQAEALAERVASLEVFQCVEVLVLPATEHEYAIFGDVFAYPGQQATAEAAVSAAIAAWQVRLGYGDIIRLSDVWRYLFTDTSINYVQLGDLPLEYGVPTYELSVLVNSLVFHEAP